MVFGVFCDGVWFVVVLIFLFLVWIMFYVCFDGGYVRVFFLVFGVFCFFYDIFYCFEFFFRVCSYFIDIILNWL